MNQYESILNSLDYLMRDSNKWIYYPLTNDLPNDFENFSNKDNGFLEKILRAGGKFSSQIDRVIQYLSAERYAHIISTYLVGLCLYSKSQYVRDNINKYLHSFDLCPEYIENRFRYIWLMICFFHDIGYAIEDGYTSEQEFTQGNPPSFEDSFLPTIFTNSLFDRYARYRKECMGKEDHGIWSGRIMYSEISRLREEKFKSINENCLQSKDCSCDGLCCKPELDMLYAKVSRTIMAHNIYYADDSSKICYQCMHLDKLITRKKRNINMQDYPLLFFFDLVDTIEPVKRPELSSSLKEILWRINDKSITFDLSQLPCLKRIQYTRQLTGMNSWLTSVRTDQDNCRIRVKLSK